MSTHPTIAAFGDSGGRLTVGGVPLSRLVDRVGGTPFFAYDRRLITERVDFLRTHLPREVELGYAIKANPMPAVVQHLATLVDNLDVASSGELRTALDAPIRPDQVSFAGPGKGLDELSQAVAAGVTVELESETEAERLAAIGEYLGVRPRVAVRVNPDFQVKGSGMRLGGGPQQFGVDAERVPMLLKQVMSADLDMLGFHIFAGSQNLSAEIICEAQHRTAELAVRLANEAGIALRYLNLGGGFGIPYFPRDEPLDVPTVGRNLAAVITDQVRPAHPDARVAIELGRYLVGEAGVYVTRVLDRKESRGETFLVVDGGLHHQLAASGNFGQVIRKNYPVAIGNRMDERPATTVNVVGRLCTPLDLLCRGVALPDTDIGDLVVIFQAGAYGLTASPTAFLGHPAPTEVLL